MSIDREAVLRTIADTLRTFGSVRLGYVFGSFLLRSDFQDIDVAVLLARGLSPREEFKLSMAIGRALESAITPRREVDVKVLTGAPDSFQYTVIRDGLPVMARDERIRVRFEAQRIKVHLDFKATSDWLDKEFLRW